MAGYYGLYTDKYFGMSNFYILEDINISSVILQKLKNLNCLIKI